MSVGFNTEALLRGWTESWRRQGEQLELELVVLIDKSEDLSSSHLRSEVAACWSRLCANPDMIELSNAGLLVGTPVMVDARRFILDCSAEEPAQVRALAAHGEAAFADVAWLGRVEPAADVFLPSRLSELDLSRRNNLALTMATRRVPVGGMKFRPAWMSSSTVREAVSELVVSTVGQWGGPTLQLGGGVIAEVPAEFLSSACDATLTDLGSVKFWSYSDAGQIVACFPSNGLAYVQVVLRGGITPAVVSEFVRMGRDWADACDWVGLGTTEVGPTDNLGRYKNALVGVGPTPGSVRGAPAGWPTLPDVYVWSVLRELHLERLGDLRDWTVARRANGHAELAPSPLWGRYHELSIPGLTEMLLDVDRWLGSADQIRALTERPEV